MKVEDHIWANKQFHELVRKRNRFMWCLLGLMLILFFSFTFMVTFTPSLMSIELWPGAVTTIGIPIGIALILVSVILVGIYVFRANREFDRLTEDILKQARKLQG